MDSHVIALERPPHTVDLQRQHYQNLATHTFQTHFNYANYSLDDSLFYSQQQQQQQPVYQQQLETPTSTTTTEDSNSCAGRSSPFDDGNQLPTPEEFKAIVDDYLNNLSPKKRDKALVDQHRYYLIQQVLRDPRNTAISTAQFRFWVKKMFQLQSGTVDIICHDSKPVAIKENIYDILVRAHREAHHGGRDKTSALVRRKFSWIPKELVARFVRHCPFCITRRNGGQSPSTMKSNSPRYHYISSGTPVTMSTTPRHFSFDHHASSVVGTPTIKPESDVSTCSGPPSAETCFKNSPQYVAMPSITSPRQLSCFQYDREEDGFLNTDMYHLNQAFQPTTSVASLMGFRSASSSTTTNTSYSSSASSSYQNYNNYLSTLPPPQHFNVVNHGNNATTNHHPSSPLFHHQQNYMFTAYPNNTTSYCPNMLGLTACGEEKGGTNVCSDQDHSTSVQPFTQQYSQSSNNLLDHQRRQPQDPPFFNNANPLVTFVNSIPDVPFVNDI